MAKATKQQLTNRKEWFEALEGGRYPQVSGKLFQPAVKKGKDYWGYNIEPKKRGFCCLGVGAQVAGVKKAENPADGYVFPILENRIEVKRIDNGQPPNEWFAEHYGVTPKAAGKLIALGMELNDNKRLPFKEISARLREEFKKADARRARK